MGSFAVHGKSLGCHALLGAWILALALACAVLFPGGAWASDAASEPGDPCDAPEAGTGWEDAGEPDVDEEGVAEDTGDLAVAGELKVDLRDAAEDADAPVVAGDATPDRAEDGPGEETATASGSAGEPDGGSLPADEGQPYGVGTTEAYGASPNEEADGGMALDGVVTEDSGAQGQQAAPATPDVSASDDGVKAAVPAQTALKEETAVPDGMKPNVAATPRAASGSKQVQAKPPAKAKTPSKAAPQKASKTMAAQAKVSAKKAPAKTASKAKAGWYSLKSMLAANLLVKVKGSKAKDGNKLVLAKGGTATGFAFKLVKSGKYFRIKAGPGLAYRVQVNAKGKVVIAKGGGKRALFKVKSIAGSSFQLVNVATGKALAVKAGGASGSRIVAKKASATAKAQAFSLEARPGLLAEGIYSLSTALSGKRALSSKGGSLKAGASAAISDYEKELYQKWQVKAVPGKANTYTLESLATGFRLQAESGKAVKLRQAGATANQMWVPYGANGAVVFKNKATGKVLQPKKGNEAPSTPVVQVKRTDAEEQQWTIAKAQPLESGVYVLDSAANGKLALEIAGGSTAGAAAAQVGTANGSLAQRWYYDSASKTFTSVNSGKLLSVKGGKAQAGAAAVQLNHDGSASQRWQVVYAGGGAFKLLSGASSRIVLQAGAATDGSAVSMAKASDSPTQGWKPVKAVDTATTYLSLDFTLAQMAKWQKSKNPYISGYTRVAIENALDPAKGTPYKFLDLRRSTGVSAATLDKFILTGGSNGKLKGLGSVFATAAKACKINEVYLLAHAIWESGWGTSELAGGYKFKGGTIDGKKYKKGTYYNFFGIGAYDSSPLSGGRKMAIINGWSSPEKAVRGAAEWIAGNYVYGTNFSAGSRYAQPTLYDMKWDTSRSKAVKDYGWHQYATDPNWPEGIGSLMGSCFKLVKSPVVFSFIKPKYR